MSDHNPLTLKLNLREKIAYGMGDVGSNLMLCIGTLYFICSSSGGVNCNAPVYRHHLLFAG